MSFRALSSRTRKKTGHSIIEFACVALLLAIVCLLAADVGIMMLADSTNERACRDAARAAAGASDATTSLTMAQAAVSTHGKASSFLSKPTIDTQCFVYQDFGGSPPPSVSPYVEVTTFITVKLPAPIFFGKAKLDLSDTGGSMQLRKTYHFPIVKTKLYLSS